MYISRLQIPSESTIPQNLLYQGMPEQRQPPSPSGSPQISNQSIDLTSENLQALERELGEDARAGMLRQVGVSEEEIEEAIASLRRSRQEHK